MRYFYLLLIVYFWASNALGANLILTYQAAKFNIPIGKVILNYQTDGTNYYLNMDVIGQGIVKNIDEQSLSQGVLTRNDLLVSEFYQENGREIHFQENKVLKWKIDESSFFAETAKIKFADKMLDPLTAFWQIMPILRNQNQCDGISYRYFNAKSQYQIQFSKKRTQSIFKNNDALKIETSFACTLTREKLYQSAPTVNHHKIIFIQSALVPEMPIIYQTVIGKAAIKITLQKIEIH